ncbi:MAG: hypothetical protein JO020_28100 [Chloroflexi bacterium]|nr:hypothetical protein [Chloroflexota bacterium]MBV9898036.1 hypothetical protein [Chloroflexota bacterium]
MTFPDRRLERPLEPPEAHSENTQDVVPASQRNQDIERSTHELVSEGSRPLTDAERKAADRDSGPGERVYAPASERVPKTVEGHRDVIEHTDTATPERQAIGETNVSTMNTEPSFTRVPRPSNGNDYGDQPDWTTTENQSNRWMSNLSGGSAVPFGIGWLTVAIGGGIGVWLWMRWQRERNRPINRLRRQAEQARQRAYELRSQIPDMPEEAVRPAMGLGTALLTVAVVLWQQAQSRRSQVDQARSRSKDIRGRADKASRDARKRAETTSRKARDAGKQATQALAEVDWLERLMLLRDLWQERSPIAR